MHKNAALQPTPPVALPEPSPQGPPEALPSRILRHLSSTSATCAAPRYAWLRAARAGLSHRTGGAAHAVGTAWPTAGGTGRCARGGGAKRPFEFPIRSHHYIQSATRSAIMIVVALVLERVTLGMIEASTTRNPWIPCT
jgi:hypothetical protein